MNWLDDLESSFYKCPADNYGRAITFRSILFTQFGMPHEWYFKNHKTGKWITGESNDLFTMADLRSEVISPEEKVLLKQTLQCYTPAALFETKKKSEIKEITRTGILQFDFDYQDNSEYDVEDLKRCVFNLPFIAFCGLSCSGKGFYALALISEPEKIEKYAEHCFKVFESYGIKPDTSKGRNTNDLRYVSYDANMLVKENPVPLRIKRFHEKPKQKVTTEIKTTTWLPNLINEISIATKGHRFPTIQRIAFTAGGTNDTSLLEQIKNSISNNPQFDGEHEKYFKCADDCFKDGQLKPFSK